MAGAPTASAAGPCPAAGCHPQPSPNPQSSPTPTGPPAPGGGGPAPRIFPTAPYAYKVCTGPNGDGTVSETQVDTCQIFLTGGGGPFFAGDHLTIAVAAPQVSIPATIVPHTAIHQVAFYCSVISSQVTRFCPGVPVPIDVTGAGAAVVDEIPPTFTSIPADLTADATGPVDTVVTCASPTAVDNAPGPVAVSCVPASGSTFTVGTTAVVCTATDVSGNTATSTFNVTIRNTFESLCRVTASEVTDEGVAHSLRVKLEGAADSSAAGDTQAMDGKLGAFENEVVAQGGKSLSAQEAQDLAGLAQLLTS